MPVAPGFVETDVAASVLSGAVIGNEAAGQVQRDVLGEALAAAHVGWEAGFTPEGRAWSMQRWFAEHLEGIWREPDNGIWESRGARQHFVYSKVMCWVAFDRMIKGAERFGLDGPVARWRAVARGDP